MAKYKYAMEYEENGDSKIYIPEALWKEKVKQDKPVYLGDFMDILPHNCLFLKAVTGAGATTLAIQDPQHSIIALPTRNTVASKWVIRDKETNEIIGYNTDLFCVYGGLNDTKEALAHYIEKRTFEEAPIKIVCTYDQVQKIALWLCGKKLEKGEYVQDQSKGAWAFCLDDFRLFIDEIHQVLEDFCDDRRNTNIRGMLHTISLFKDVTCITATPLEKKHTLYEIRHLPVCRVIFPTMPKRKIIKKWCPRMGSTVENLVVDYLEGREIGNAYIFVNSVKFIADVIKGIKKKIPGFNVTDYKEKIRVICGDNEVNDEKIKNAVTSLIGDKDFISYMEKMSQKGENRNLAMEIEARISRQITEFAGIESFIDSINSDKKKINFLTKSSWLGADVFDEEAQIYIVTDGARKQTMIDVSTSLIQILGRIRNSKNNKAYLYLNQNRYLLNEAEGDIETQFQKDKEEREKNAEDFFFFLNRNPLLAKAVDIDVRKAQCYVLFNRQTGTFEKSDYLEMYDEISYRILQGDYRSSANLSAKLVEAGFDVEDENEKNEPFKALKDKVRNPASRTTFRQIYEEYSHLRDGKGLIQAMLFEPNPEALRTTFEAIEPYVKGAYEYLGNEMVKALDYKRREIVTLVDKAEIREKEKHIRRNLNLRIKVGRTYTTAELDKILLVIQNSLNLERKLKIADYFEVMTTTMKDEDGKKVSAKKIIGHRSKKED